MKKKIIILLLLACIALPVKAQTELMDSITDIASDSQLTFQERYQRISSLKDELNLLTKEIIEGYRLLLDEARAYPDKKYILSLYGKLVSDLSLMGYYTEGNVYVDSVYHYINQVSDPVEIGKAYFRLFDNATGELQRSYLFKAIPYLEQSPEGSRTLAKIYYYLSPAYFWVRDYENVKKMMDKLFELAAKYDCQESLVRAYSIKTAYFSALYDNNPSANEMLDSIFVSERRAIEIFEQIERPSHRLAWTIAYNYYNLAVTVLDTDAPNALEKALEYVEKAVCQADPSDIVILTSYHDIRGNVFLKQGKLEEAEKEAQAQLEILSKHEESRFLERREVYKLLANIAIAKGNYREALEYEKQRNEYDRKIFDSERYEAIERVKTEYEVSRKEDEIRQLTEINRYQRQISYLYLFLGLLFVFGLLLLLFLLQLKRRTTTAQLQIAQLEKTEVEIQVQLKEEKLKRTELEKYEALLSNRFKEQEIDESKRQLELLSLQKEEMEEQISNQTSALKKYEMHLEQIESKFHSRSLSGLLEDIKQLICKRLGNNSQTKAYLQKIDKVEDALFIQIDTKSEGKLSPTHIRYCICFIIGMSIKDIADCFCVEVSSVHTTRNRLKQRLKLDKDENIDVYFKNLIKF